MGLRIPKKSEPNMTIYLLFGTIPTFRRVLNVHLISMRWLVTPKVEVVGPRWP